MSKKVRRKRIILQSVVIAFVLTFAWIGVLVGLQMLKSGGHSFRAETQEVLEHISNGGTSSQKLLYEEAAQGFRDTMVESTFLTLCVRINQTLGPFKKVLATYDPKVNSGPQGKTGHVTVSLEFEKGKTTGSFSYHFVDDKWRLLGLYIELTDEQVDAYGPLYEFKKANKEASAEVLALITEVLERVNRGEAELVHAAAHRDFVTPLQPFLDQRASEKRALGDFVRVLHITHSWQAKPALHANVTCVLEFTKDGAIVKTEARFEFRRDQVEVPWQLFKYKVNLPQVVVPRIPLPNR